MKKILKTIMADKLLLGLTVVLLLVTGVSASLIVVKAGEFFFKKAEIEVIDFTNLTESEIRDWYEKEFDTSNGLEFIEEYSEDVSEGKVISQDPLSGEKITVDSGLKIVLSKGKDPNKTFNLPDFVTEKMTKKDAEDFFEKNGFTNVNYAYKIIEDEDIAKDVIVDINRTGAVKRSDMIIVTLSAGDDEDLVEVIVPDFEAYSVQEAKEWGSANSITVNFDYVFSNTHEAGKIISQSVGEGEVLKGGSSLTLKVSKGKGITIADLLNKTVDQVKTYASENGFVLDIQYAYSDSIKEGLVISSSPDSGGLLAKGDTLVIVVSAGVDPDNVRVDIEDYAGKSEAELLAYLKEIGIKSLKESDVYSDSVDEGLVAYNTSGNVALSQTISYALSLGSYEIDLDDFEETSLKDAQALVDSVNGRGANIKLNFSTVKTSEYAENTLFGCRLANSRTVNCNLAATGGSSDTSDGDHYIEANTQIYEGYPLSVDSTRKAVEENLSYFDLSITEEVSELPAGSIIKITVNGDSYRSGYYPADTKVKVVISSGFIN